MAPVDVTAEVSIERPAAEVADYAFDPANDREWIGGIKTARTLTDGPFGVGTRVERLAGFLGRKIEYVLEVTGYRPAAEVVMESAKSPFPMKVTYSLIDAGADGRDATVARIRVEGDPTGFYKLGGRFMAPMVRRNISGDRVRLKRIMESRTH